VLKRDVKLQLSEAHAHRRFAWGFCNAVVPHTKLMCCRAKVEFCRKHAIIFASCKQWTISWLSASRCRRMSWPSWTLCGNSAKTCARRTTSSASCFSSTALSCRHYLHRMNLVVFDHVCCWSSSHLIDAWLIVGYLREYCFPWGGQIVWLFVFYFLCHLASESLTILWIVPVFTVEINRLFHNCCKDVLGARHKYVDNHFDAG